jgi:glycosyltransferase involved in cell wall biosynthesis
MKVSVVMIFLDGEAFIDEAIRSVVDQKLEDWELLLVDDGSLDRSTAIAREWAMLDPRISYLEHDGHANLGMSASRNLGLASAAGEYLAFLDCDDVWLPTHLSHLVEVLDADPTLDAAYSAHKVWYSWTGVPRDQLRDQVVPLGVEPDTVVEAPGLLAVYRRTRGGAVPAIHSIVARRSAVERVGGFEASFRSSFEDQVYFAKLGLGFRTYVSGACDALYRQHPGSSCAVAERERTYHPNLPNPAERTYLEWLEGYLVESGVTSGEIWESVQAALVVYRRPLHADALRARAEKLAWLAKRALRQAVS